jgi:hypothetical protein
MLRVDTNKMALERMNRIAFLRDILIMSSLNKETNLLEIKCNVKSTVEKSTKWRASGGGVRRDAMQRRRWAMADR